MQRDDNKDDQTEKMDKRRIDQSEKKPRDLERPERPKDTPKDTPKDRDD